MKRLTATAAQQPSLPPRWRTNPKTQRRHRIAWPAETREFWRVWADSPLSVEFTETDWLELLIAARLHAAVVEGDLKSAPELRLRVAKFGATPEDRARLRIAFVAADEAEKPKPERKSVSRYDGLKSVGGGNAVARPELSG
jgi:hypothetical protein